uniref:Inositol hexakisphosphate and diphosphoinositol-pentakisphosphate kinase n=1 Tax=Auxenochlorella protothecoides TaxID=3075 RepID=A0A1D1ZXV8_AUXPR
MRSAQSTTLAEFRRDQVASMVGQQQAKQDGAPPAINRVHSAPRLSQGEDALPKIVVGICAMDKKARSKQMANIMKRLSRYGEFEVVVFGDDTILNAPVEDWPVVGCLLAWHSKGFPLKKAQQYVVLRRPYLVNDVFAQDLLLDRRLVYRKLVESGIPVPRHIIVDRDHLESGQDPEGFVETEDYVELKGERICKPFVEKPASGDDHNIYIYYPFSMGGGVKRLFRKVNNRSADYDATHPGTVRRDASYIYEDFLTTGGTDVKVYTIGPRYAHAEARKSPVVDGKVQRAADGKELRFPVLLSPQEKETARMVSLAFGQRICGFDLLRSERGKSYVCDVNGWSFVKNSTKYYDDAAGILRMVILSAVAPHRLLAPPNPPMSLSDPANPEDAIGNHACLGSMSDIHEGEEDDEEVAAKAALFAQLAGTQEDDLTLRPDEELRCVLAIIRHGDRTPKQKMKMKVTQAPLLALCNKYLDSKGKQAKLKSPSELQDLLDVVRQLLEELEMPRAKPAEASLPEDQAATAADDTLQDEEFREKFRIVKTILEQGGQFAGINRKVQLKPLRWASPAEGEPAARPRVAEALLILKHGGVLTHAGRGQAEALGSLFRNIMYPQHGPSGGGLLRLHSTYRHDLKIYSSDEGRVQCSAAAFTKGLLDLEGSALTPILVSLVTKDTGMLDAYGKGASEDIQRAKAELYAQMTLDPETGTSRCAAPHSTTPLVSPPASPKPAEGVGRGGSAESSVHGQARSLSRNASASASTIRAAASALKLAQGTLADSEAEGFVEGASNIEGRPHIFPMPEQPLETLKTMHVLLGALVEDLHQLCVEEQRPNADAGRSYSVLNQDPKDWVFEDDKPCSGERLLLLYDRWRKLAKAFYSEKKSQFDISKVPDIYDAAKYDAIHNATIMGPKIKDVYLTAKVLADAAIPNEYGIEPEGRLRISTAICSQLLGKLLADMAYMREESLATAGHAGSGDSLEYEVPLGAEPEPMGGSPHAERDGEEDGDDSSLHRLCPSYATDINSPLRHVRTRIYFTSESHMHALMNIVRYAHLGTGSNGEALSSVLSSEGQEVLASTRELDYMTHWVFRMFENKSLPLNDPRRFRVQILFSPGAAHNPLEVVPIQMNHTLPVRARVPVHSKEDPTEGKGGVPLAQLESTLKPYAKPFKRQSEPYSMRATELNSQTSELDYWM